MYLSAFFSQAIGRAWRTGQTRPVIVYRLVMSGTIEELMFQTAASKQAMLRSALFSHLYGTTLITLPFLEESCQFYFSGRGREKDIWKEIKDSGIDDPILEKLAVTHQRDGEPGEKVVQKIMKYSSKG